MKLLSYLFVAALAAGAGFAAGKVTTHAAISTAESSQPQTFDPDGFGSSAKDLVVAAVERHDNFHPEVACPTRVALSKGVLFTCEALVRGSLVPVDLEVISPLGFLRVVDVGLSLPEYREYRWCKAHNALEGRASCSTAYESR